MLPTNREPTHPGEMLLREFLEPMEVSQACLSEHLSWPYARLNEIINKKRGVSPDSAIALSEALATTPEFWLNLQRNWDLWHAKKNHVEVAPLKKVC